MNHFYRAKCLTLFVLYQFLVPSHTKSLENSIPLEDNKVQDPDINHDVAAVAADTLPESGTANDADDKTQFSKIKDRYALMRVAHKPTNWPMGTVPYYLDTESYDEVIAERIRDAMDFIESSSCVVFQRLKNSIVPRDYWLLITNPRKERECVHKVEIGPQRELMLVIGYDCMSSRDILHALLHVLGFNDEVTHPQRDTYIRVLWENIHPKYRPLFRQNRQELPYKTRVEYDPMSIMHFHDRAYSANGKPTVVPLIPGLLFTPTDSLSQLDIMKLGLAFGHECNKRKVDQLMDTCKKALITDLGSSAEDKQTAEHTDKDAGEKMDHKLEDVEEDSENIEDQDIDNRNPKTDLDSPEQSIELFGMDYERGADLEATEIRGNGSKVTFDIGRMA